MKTNLRSKLCFAVVCLGALAAAGQQTATAPSLVGSSKVVPNLITYSGVLNDAAGRTITGITGVTFLLYKDAQGGTPLWLETQNVQPDKRGHYSVMLGSTSSTGLPADIFVAGEARWLGVQAQGQPEQPRVMLMSVPYALKAADAETIGGLPPSAFVLAVPEAVGADQTSQASSLTSSNAGALPPATVTGSGTANFVPLWTSASNLANSVMFQSGSGSTAKIGINTTTPIAALDIKGSTNLQGLLNSAATGTATASSGKASQAQNFVASAFSSTSGAAVKQTFQWKAEPAGNNAANPSGTLNLLFGSGTNAPAETGLKISNKGLFTFAAGQAFPGTGSVTSVAFSASSSDFTVSGSPITKSGTLTLAWTNPPTSANTANAIVKRDGTGSFSVTGINGSGTFATTTGNTNGIMVNASPVNAVAIQANAIAGSGGTIGVIGATVSPDSNSTGVWGQANNSSSAASFTEGVVGTSQSPVGIGVLGFGRGGTSTTADSLLGSYSAGVWGDNRIGGVNVGIGVLATSDVGNALVAENNSGTETAIFRNETTAAGGNLVIMDAPNLGTFCLVDTSGDLACTGTKSAVVRVKDGRQVALYAVEAPENWFEDFGSGRLVGGSATIQLDATYAQTVNLGTEYHVFLTPNGDCKGLYVERKGLTSFEVRELGGGTSTVGFDYRIVARRLGHESKRLVDMTSVLEKASLRLHRGMKTAANQR